MLVPSTNRLRSDVHCLMTGLNRGEHRLPLPLDRRAVGVQLNLEARLGEHLLAGGDVGGQVHTHTDRHHAQIHDHLHGQPWRSPLCWWVDSFASHNKARSVCPGTWLLSRDAVPRGSGAAARGPDQPCQQGQQSIRHRSSPRATGVHEGGFMTPAQAPWTLWAGSPGPEGC